MGPIMARNAGLYSDGYVAVGVRRRSATTC